DSARQTGRHCKSASRPGPPRAVTVPVAAGNGIDLDQGPARGGSGTSASTYRHPATQMHIFHEVAQP
ncbi:hypothetical protein, partial [Xanthomonas translucens]|uniref:hypothetical protein n=1 Tax=Xanthomonas campestris pv. translucens TaxID=343 RepID=UPI0019D359A3